jgi:hypothetical protein
LLSGFGVINEVYPVGAVATTFGAAGQLYQGPRSGTLVARFSF